MRYYVTVDQKTYEVEIDGDCVTVDGELLKAELFHVSGTPVRRLSINGASHRVVADRGVARGMWELHIDSDRVTAEVVDERTSAIRAMTGASNAPHGPKPVRAPMPGMVVRVEVEVGDHVGAGQGVVIMEAMKMENELKAEGAGVVARVAVQPGTAVEKGAVIMEFEQSDVRERPHEQRKPGA